MMTKEQFAKCIVEREEKAGVENVYQSSCYAVAADFLGILNENDSEYAKSRSGILFEFWENDVNFLTVREILNLLPEKLND